MSRFSQQLPQRVKDPDAVVTYAIEWGDWLAEFSGESIDSAVWSVEGSADTPVLATQNPTIDGTKTVIQLTGGVVGKTYLVRCAMSTSLYSDDEIRSIEVRIAKT